MVRYAVDDWYGVYIHMKYSKSTGKKDIKTSTAKGPGIMK